MTMNNKRKTNLNQEVLRVESISISVIGGEGWEGGQQANFPQPGKLASIQTLLSSLRERNPARSVLIGFLILHLSSLSISIDIYPNHGFGNAPFMGNGFLLHEGGSLFIMKQPKK